MGGLPISEYRICSEDGVAVREEASNLSFVIGIRRCGEIARSTEETFDGWLRLADAPGWLSRRGVVLEAVGPTPQLAVTQLADDSGRQLFEVIAESGVQLRREPWSDAEVLSSRSLGEFILCESQTNHGWLRVG